MYHYSPVTLVTQPRTTTPKLPSTTPLSPEEELYEQKQCSRCGIQYALAVNPGPCRYHPGVYREFEIFSPNSGGWSCCRETSLDAKLDSHLPGCSTAQHHLEDKSLNHYKQQFDFDLNEAKKATESLKQGQEKSMNTKKPKVEQKETPKEYLIHSLSHLDTLKLLALKYNCSISDLKAANNLFSDNISHLFELRIPMKDGYKPPNPDQSEENRKRFVLLTGSTPSEADYYLEETQQDLQKALALYKEDIAAVELKNTCK